MSQFTVVFGTVLSVSVVTFFLLIIEHLTGLVITIKYLDKKYIIYKENVYTKLCSNKSAASKTHKVIFKSSTCDVVRCMS